MQNKDHVSVNRRWTFTTVDNTVITDPELSTVQKMVFVALCHFANSRGESAYPSYATIARIASCSRRAAITAIGELLKRGYLSKASRANENGATSNLYTIENKRDIAPPSEPDALGVVNEVHWGGERGAPEGDPFNDNQLKKRGKHAPTQLPVNTTTLDTLRAEYGEVAVERYMERVKDYCDSKGKKYKDYSAACRTFMRRAEAEGKLSRSMPMRKVEPLPSHYYDQVAR